VTRTPLSRSKDQRSRSPGRFTHRGVYTSGSCSGERGKVFTAGTYCYVAVCRLGGARRFGGYRGRRGAGAYRGGRLSTACYGYLELRQGWGYGWVGVLPYYAWTVCATRRLFNSDFVTPVAMAEVCALLSAVLVTVVLPFCCCTNKKLS